MDIQKLLDSPDRTGTVTLPAGEYEGNFVIKKSCRVKGAGTVLISGSPGPALTVNGKNVSVSGVTVELSGGGGQVAVYCRPDTTFSDTELSGLLVGIPKEERYWGLPKIVSLGTLPAERELSFAMELYVPAEAELTSGFHDIFLSADSLSPGFNTVTLTVGRLRSGSLLHGFISVRSAVTGIVREILVTGVIGDENAPPPAGYMLCTVDREAPARHDEFLRTFDINSLGGPEPERVEVPLEPINENVRGSHTVPESGEDIRIFAGKRLPLPGALYRIELLYSSAVPEPDIEAYLFMLDRDGRALSDRGLVFFGNRRSEDGSVRYEGKQLLVDFRDIQPEITKMALMYSMYGGDPAHLFRNLKGGEVSLLCENGVHLRLPLESGINCRTIIAAAFEKTDDVWEMTASGKGVTMRLADVCRGYGVNVV